MRRTMCRAARIETAGEGNGPAAVSPPASPNQTVATKRRSDDSRRGVAPSTLRSRPRLRTIPSDDDHEDDDEGDDDGDVDVGVVVLAEAAVAEIIGPTNAASDDRVRSAATRSMAPTTMRRGGGAAPSFIGGVVSFDGRGVARWSWFVGKSFE